MRWRERGVSGLSFFYKGMDIIINSRYLSNTATLGIRASTHGSEGDTSIRCRGMYKGKDVRAIIRERERQRERKKQGIGRHLVVLKSRVPCARSCRGKHESLSAMLKSGFIMSVMGSP